MTDLQKTLIDMSTLTSIVGNTKSGLDAALGKDDKWNQTTSTPNSDRFVVLYLADKTKIIAQWAERKDSIFRAGKQWLDRDGKFRATNLNPAIN